jgi:hypothetical protein
VSADDCARAAGVVARADASGGEQQWAHAVVAACPEQIGAALASAVRGSGTRADQSARERISSMARRVRDGRVFEAAAAVARDPAAGAAPRRTALTVLAYQLDRAGYIDPVRLAEARDDEVCPRSYLSHDLPSADGAPLPSGAATTARTLAKALAADSSQPASVRVAARCVMAAAYVAGATRTP